MLVRVRRHSVVHSPCKPKPWTMSPKNSVRMANTVQVANFLNHLAFNVDLSSVEPSEEARTSGNDARQTLYDPMRRKLAMSGM